MKFFILPIVFTTFYFFCSECKSQSKTRIFAFDTLLTDCILNIPFDLKKKNEPIVATMAKLLSGKELIFMQYNAKETPHYTFTRCFLSSESDDNYIFYNLTTKSDKETGIKRSTAFSRRDKWDRFYEAICFDEILKDNPILKKMFLESNNF